MLRKRIKKRQDRWERRREKWRRQRRMQWKKQYIRVKIKERTEYMTKQTNTGCDGERVLNMFLLHDAFTVVSFLILPMNRRKVHFKTCNIIFVTKLHYFEWKIVTMILLQVLFHFTPLAVTLKKSSVLAEKWMIDYEYRKIYNIYQFSYLVELPSNDERKKNNNYPNAIEKLKKK